MKRLLKKPVVKRRLSFGGKATPAPAKDNQEQQRMQLLVQGEFTRLTHSVDAAKRDGSLSRLDLVARVLAACYTVLDSWND